jgi:hypothetical protein
MPDSYHVVRDPTLEEPRAGSVRLAFAACSRDRLNGVTSTRDKAVSTPKKRVKPSSKPSDAKPSDAKPSSKKDQAIPARAKSTGGAAAVVAIIPRSTKRSAIPDKHRARKAKHAGDAGTPSKTPVRRAATATPKASGVAAPDGRVRTPNTGRTTRIAIDRSPALPDAAAIAGSGSTSEGTRARLELEGANRVMELHWGDDAPSSRRSGLVQRWVKRGDALLRRLAEHGAARHEYRADLKDGRFVWIDPEGRVSAEARAQVLCSWSRSTSALSMAWADALVRDVGIARVDGIASERDDVDEEGAWRVAMEAAEGSKAEYLYRVNTPHAWYFLALSELTFHPARESFTPGTPVGLVRRGLAETLRAVESRAEPAEVVRQRITSLGEAFLLEAEYAYRGTDWVARLQRAGRRLVALAEQLPRPSYGSVAAGRLAGEWLDRQITIDLSDALALLEDEWALFT